MGVQPSTTVKAGTLGKKYEYLRTVWVSNTATALVDIIQWYEGMTTKMYAYNKSFG
jgi:hypothetical protein